MKRMHLFEFEDLPFCPAIIREITTDFLLGLYNVFHIYEPAYAKIVDVLNKSKINAIVDCCSGSGGPILQLRDYLDKNGKEEVTITLTDYYPNKVIFNDLEKRYPNKIVGHFHAQNACQLPSALYGMRTFFSSFHHFSPDSALKILQNAVASGSPIGIFECTAREPMDFIRALLSPLLMLFILPFSKRLNWKKFLLTYVLPISPFINMWDYIASNLRTYSKFELNQLIAKIPNAQYQWETDRVWSHKGKCYITYLVGYRI